MYEKMSKSRGNVVLPEEVVHGVADLKPGYEFRDRFGHVLDWKEEGVWRNPVSHCYFTATCRGRHPVFFHEEGNPIPCLLATEGKSIVQHESDIEYWIWLIHKYETEDDLS